MEKRKDKISAKVAQDQLDQLLNKYDIDIDDAPNKEQKKVLETSFHRIKKSIRRGFLEIKVDDQSGKLVVVHHLQEKKGTTVEYKGISGKNKIEMKEREEQDQYGKIYAMMGSLSGLGYSAIRDFEGIDMSIAESLGSIFLLV